MGTRRGILVRLGPEGVIARYPLQSGTLTIGRGADNTVVIADNRVSRQHATLALDASGTVKVSDLGSTHYTFVDGEPVENAPLKHGARVKIADLFEFLWLDREDPAIEEAVLRALRAPSAPALPGTPATGFMATQLQSLMDDLNNTAIDSVALKRMQERVDRRISDLQCLYEIGTAINSELDLDRVLHLILKNVIGAAGAERGFILLGEASALRSAQARDVNGPLEPHELKTYSNSIARKAIESRQTVWTADTRNDPELASTSMMNYKIRSAICAPLLSKGHALGALYVDAKSSLKQFSARDAEFFFALASQSALAIENATLVDRVKATIARLDRKVLELSALYSISEKLVHSTDEDAMLAVILDRSIDILGAERGAVLLHAPEVGRMTVRMVRGNLAPGLLLGRELADGAGTALEVVESGQGRIAELVPADPLFELFGEVGRPPRQVLCVPLKRQEENIGVITLLRSAVPAGFQDEDLQLMTSIASQAAVTIENSRLYHMAVFDGLTGLYVRRYFDGWFQKEFERARRYGSDFALIVLDIDYFKRFNDSYGHQTGDAVLREVAAILKSHIRGSDLAARVGGEEFAIGLPQTNLAGAVQFAERLRIHIESHRVKAGDKELRVTVSLGISSLEVSHPEDRTRMFAAADRALYAAKSRGRNRHVTHDPSLDRG